MVVLVFSILVGLSAVLVTTIDGRLPNALENELALGECDLTADNWVVFLKLSDDLILLFWRQLRQLPQYLALVLLREACFLASPTALGGLGAGATTIEVAHASHGHVIEIAKCVLDAPHTHWTQHVLFFDYLLSFVMRNILSCHIVIIYSYAFLLE